MICDLCAGPVARQNIVGVCVRNPDCRRENANRRGRSRSRQQRDAANARERANYAHGKRWKYIERTYGLTRNQFESLLKSQGNVCAICHGIPEGKGRCGQWNIDHDHVTGKVRGLLCWSCNSALGYAKDSPGVLRACAEYLEHYANGNQQAA